MFPNSPPSLQLPPLNDAGDRERSIVATLLYFDLFAFPLRAEELVRFAHRAGMDGHFTAREVARESEWWSSRDGFWFLKGREQLIARRHELSQVTPRKFAHARRWARLLQIIPGVRFVGITGSLAMQSAIADDDIDILIIAARGRLWLTRALVLSALWSLGVKRPDDGRMEHPNQVCANIFLREDDLTIPDHNLFIAHEICQMQPLLGPGIYARFLNANAWTRNFLPQWEPATPQWEDRRPLRMVQRSFEIALGGPIRVSLERELERRQLARIHHKHARGHNVGIKLSPTQLRFHPRDLSQHIITAFDERWNAISSKVETFKVSDELGRPRHLKVEESR
jgi:hypothetical protein